MTLLLDWSNIGEIVVATGALGTASFGLVDATKAFGGGISNVGYGFVREALAPFEPALLLIDNKQPYAVLQANWLNGVDKAQQKVAAKDLIRLGLTGTTASKLAAALPNVDGAKLAAVVKKIDAGEALVEDEVTILGRFDAIIDARLSAAFERADQKYRNWARVAAAVIAIILAEIGAFVVIQPFDGGTIIAALLVGILATPVAPIAKDLASAISTAVSAFKTVRR